MAHYVIRVATSAVVVAAFVVTAILGALSGVIFAYVDDLPQISAIDHYNPSVITRVFGANGQPIGEFAVQRRLIIGYDDIAPRLREAIISAEDGDFNRHFGLSLSSIAVRLTTDILDAGRGVLTRRSSRPAGASTITQQLARNLFPDTVGFDVTLERKIKEAIVALQIEKRYTKREILTLYANQIHLGHGTYGVEAASRMYFGKSAKDVSLEEAALLAGIIQTPARQSPFANIEAATRRRNYTLERMADEGYISRAEAEAARQKPVLVRGQPQPPRSITPFFLEEVRKHLERQYGVKALYEGGLSVTTTIDPALQLIANGALERGLRRLDKRRGFRRPSRSVLTEGQTVEGFKDERWARPLAVGDVVPAVVLSVGRPPSSAGAALRIGRYHANLTREGFSWTRRSSAADLMKVGDLVEVEIRKLDEETGTAVVGLEQTPLVEGALLAIENRTGHIKAMVGGWDFGRSKFNRAVQAYRQLGSTFKPVLYTAAIDRGFTPASQLIDEPVSYPSGDGRVYAPQNYDHKFEGVVTLRRALEQSRNVPAIRMMDTLGPANVIAYAKRFGFAQQFPPYLPIALGAGDATLLEVTSAFSVFPNQGVRMIPFGIVKVTDRDGNLLEEHRPQPADVIRADTAFVMVNLLRGVVQRGTAAAAAGMKWPLAGKTGTVDDNTDAWFIGFDPDVTVGVWVGFDEKKPLGRNETGAVAALPVWMEFMAGYIGSRADQDRPPDFQAPGNIVYLPVDRASGAVQSAEVAGTIREAFIAGTQPSVLPQQP